MARAPGKLQDRIKDIVSRKTKLRFTTNLVGKEKNLLIDMTFSCESTQQKGIPCMLRQQFKHLDWAPRIYGALWFPIEFQADQNPLG